MAWTLLRAILITYLIVLALLWIFQTHLIYFPSSARAAELDTAARDRGLEPWLLADGTAAGWCSRGTGNAWVVFHGNAGFALHRTHFVAMLRAADPDASVYIFEYPGYGARPGPPSEGRIATAAVAAVQDLAANRGGKIILIGESIGASFAARVAERMGGRVGALLLITPFDRLANVAAYHYPFIMPVRWILRERHDTAAALGSYRGRAAILVAEHDSVVPRRFGEALHRGLICDKRLWLIHGADHNSIPYHPSATWWREAIAFCTSP
ncbi:MAG TPA: alpha/beta fold hydrolase [Verrucomicrobiae bacterium]|mgnify:CR=1 FL=1|nr:alpha/beta fold hydrolase [Verrucomicrobiae bacterium]